MKYSPIDYPGKAVGMEWEARVHELDTMLCNDPENLNALVGLSDTLLLLWCFGFYSRSRSMPRARDAAERAVQLHPQSGRAHMVLAAQNMSDWRWVEAQEHFDIAVKLQPDHAILNHYYALYQITAFGDIETAYRYSQRSVELDDSDTLVIGLASIMYFARDFHEMVDLLVPFIKEHPDFGPAYDWLGMAYVQLGQFEESISTYRHAVELADNTMEVVSGLGHAYGMAGRHREAREVLDQMLEAVKQTYVPQVQIAFVYAGLEDFPTALDWLERAYEVKAWEIAFMREEPWLECLNDQPRFKAIVDKVGFPARRM